MIPLIIGGVALATITYGWENIQFYKDWMGFAQANGIIAEFKGPSLATSKQSVNANIFLELFKEIIKDSSYVERLKRHYKLFKNEIGEKSISENQIVMPARIRRNEPCTCGSGLKYKKCCGK